MLALAALLLQSVLVVPTEYATPRMAVDAAQPGDLILLRGGVWRNGLRIDKSITLHADPRATFMREEVTSGAPSTLVLDTGPGDVVNLSGLDIELEGLVDSAPSTRIRPAIATSDSSSLSTLRLYRTAAQACRYFSADGQIPGAPGIRVRADVVEVIDSFVGASDSTNGGSGFWFVRGFSGIENNQGDVVMNGGLVRGAFRDATTRNGFYPFNFNPHTAPGIQAAGRVFWLKGRVESGQPGRVYDTKLGVDYPDILLPGPRISASAVFITSELLGL